MPEGVDEGEVSEEDEGGETKRSTFTKKIKLCKKLSDLISIPRTRYTDIHSLKANSKYLGSDTLMPLCPWGPFTTYALLSYVIRHKL